MLGAPTPRHTNRLWRTSVIVEPSQEFGATSEIGCLIVGGAAV